MTKELEAGIIKILEDCGIDLASKGYGYVMEAVVLIIEEGQKSKANNWHK